MCQIKPKVRCRFGKRTITVVKEKLIGFITLGYNINIDKTIAININSGKTAAGIALGGCRLGEGIRYRQAD